MQASCCCIGLTPVDNGDLRVMVANGDRLTCEGVVRHVALRISQEHFIVTCFELDLGRFDLLSVDYIRTLGPILWDFDTHTLSFRWGGSKVLWHGADYGCHDARSSPMLNAITTDRKLPLLDHPLSRAATIAPL